MKLFMLFFNIVNLILVLRVTSSVSSIKLTVWLDVEKINVFKNGETLTFVCLVKPSLIYTYTAKYHKIELESSDGIFLLPIQCAYTRDFEYYSCFADYKMNFTSTILKVTCTSKNGFLWTESASLALLRIENSVSTQLNLNLMIKKQGNPISEVTDFKTGDVLNFICEDTSYRNTEIEVKYKDVKYIVPVKLSSNDKGRKSSGFFKMNFTSPTVDATCFAVTQNIGRVAQVVLTLYRSVELDTGSKLEVVANPSGTKSTFEEFYLVYIAIGVGVVIFIGISICIVKTFKKGKLEETKKLRASGTYEHFTNESQEPTPSFPRGPKLEQTYLAPVDLLESPYATSKPQDTDTYALPYTPSNVEELYSKPVPKNSKINELYTQVLPKSIRNNQNKSSKYINSGMNDEITYAEIGHQNINVINQNYANIGEKNQKNIVPEDNYATIAHSNTDYANLKKENGKENGKSKDEQYTNVFANDPYVNAKRDDYAEPSYCELGRKH